MKKRRIKQIGSIMLSALLILGQCFSGGGGFVSRFFGVMADEMQEEPAVQYDIVETNSDVNGVVLVTDEAAQVLKFGLLPAGEVACGVEITNPFAGKEELVETPQEAFANNEIPFNGLTYEYSDYSGTYKKVATYSKYFCGFYQKGWRVSYRELNSGLTLINKENAIKAYEMAKAYLVDNNIIGSSGVAAQYVKEIEECTDGSVIWSSSALGSYAKKLVAISNVDDITLKDIHWHSNGPARGGGELQDPSTIEGEFTYPVPKWNTGVTISTWVKVPENAQNSAPIFCFVNDLDETGLVLRTDGSLIFAQDYDYVKNYYSAKYTGGAPMEQKGQWVYVTLSVKNDEFHVYYNGSKATETVNSDIIKEDSSVGKEFNYGFGFANQEERIESLLREESGAYVYLLKNFGDEKNPDYADFDKYYTDTSATSVMELITYEDTRLFIGGDDGTAFCSATIEDGDGNNSSNSNDGMYLATCNEYCSYMKIGHMSFEDSPVLTTGSALKVYYAATQMKKTFTDQVDLFTLVEDSDIPVISEEPDETETISGESIEFLSEEYANQLYNYRPGLEGKCRTSFLGKLSTGEYQTVIYNNNKLYINNFDSNYQWSSAKIIDLELPLWGGLYLGESYNYVVCGRGYDSSEENGGEVYRIIKYDKNFNRISSISLNSDETYTAIPFVGGNVSIDESESLLTVYTSRLRLDEHQSNIAIRINTDTMSITNEFGMVKFPDVHVSHSFRQIFKYDSEEPVYVDVSDGAPQRSIFIQVNKYRKSLIDITGFDGDNRTEAELSGLEISDTHCLVTGSYINQYICNIYLSCIDKNTGEVKTQWLTNSSPFAPKYVHNPRIVKISEDRFVVMWGSNCLNEYIVNYILVDMEGNVVSELKQIAGVITDCEPIYANDKIQWLSIQNGILSFYEITDFTENGVYIPDTTELKQSDIFWDGTTDITWYDGNKTEFSISTAEQLAGLAQLVNEGNTFEGKLINLKNDIYLNDESYEYQWIPIAAYVRNDDTNINVFQGIFNGNNYTIYNMKTSDNNDGGLFGRVGEKAMVKCVNVSQGWLYSGGCIANVNEGMIVFCNNDSSVGGWNLYAVGGICNFNANLVYGCKNLGEVWGTYVGGIVGLNQEIMSTISQCCNYGLVEGSSVAAGIASENQGYLYNCYNKGIIADDYVGNGFSHAKWIFGIVYQNDHVVANCYSAGVFAYDKDSCWEIYAIAREDDVENCYTLSKNTADKNYIHTVSLKKMQSLDFIKKIDRQTYAVLPVWQQDIHNINSGLPITDADYSSYIGKYKIQPELWLMNGEKKVEVDLDTTDMVIPLNYYFYDSSPTVKIEDTDIAELSDDFTLIPKKKGITYINIYFDETENNSSADYRITVVVNAEEVLESPEPTASPEPSIEPSISPSMKPSPIPSVAPTMDSSPTPSIEPSISPSKMPSSTPSVTPSASPSVEPSVSPSTSPSDKPTTQPSPTPSVSPSVSPSMKPSPTPIMEPSVSPSMKPSPTPSVAPTMDSSPTPSIEPSVCPSMKPSPTSGVTPSMEPSASPSMVPSIEPSLTPSSEPERTLMLGDINKDNMIGLDDTMLIFKCALRVINFDDEQEQAADFDGDGSIALSEVQMHMQAVVGINTDILKTENYVIKTIDKMPKLHVKAEVIDENICYTISAENMCNLEMFSYGIVFDTDILEPIDDSPTTWSMEWLTTYIARNGGIVVSKLTETGNCIALAGVCLKDAEWNTDIATVTFKIKEGKSITDAKPIMFVPNSSTYKGDFTGAENKEDSVLTDISGLLDIVEDSLLKGDANGDKTVTLQDAQLVLKAALKITNLDQNQIKSTDVDGVKGITLADAQMVLKAALKIIRLE